MTTEPKHTPTPWVARDDGKTVALIGAEPSWIGAIEKSAHNGEANAAFIVHACNLNKAHEHVAASAERLRLWETKDEQAMEQWTEECAEDGIGSEMFYAMLKNQLWNALTALAKARGEA